MNGVVSFPRRFGAALGVALVLSAGFGAGGFQDAGGQSLTGLTGLVTVPTGELPADRMASLGAGFLHKRHLQYHDGLDHVVPYYGTLTFLPFLEVSFRFSLALNDGGREALGDRMISLRLRLLEERESRPGIVFGLHDFLRSTDVQTNHFNALYLAGTKHLKTGFGDLGLHAGYGTDWWESKLHEFVGVFGGVSFSPSTAPWATGLLEYDTHRLTAGVRVLIFDHVQLTGALQGMDVFVGGAAVRVGL